MDQVQVGVFLSDGGNQLTKILDYNAITEFVKKVAGVVFVARGS